MNTIAASPLDRLHPQVAAAMLTRWPMPCEEMMQTERGTERPGWTPSSEDLFAEDWQVVT